MVYLLSLEVAGDVLYVFPFSQVTSALSYEVKGILINFLLWFGLNLGIVGLFATIALQWPVCHYRIFSSKGERLTSDDLLGLMLPNQKLDVYKSVNFYKGSKGWQILAWVCALVSITWNVVLTSFG